MLIASTVLIFTFIGTLGAWRPDIDINRVKLLPKEESRYKHSKINHNRRSVFPNHNDYGDHSGGVPELRSPMQALPNLPTSSKTFKVHQPREDPRLFYLSEAYAKEINGKDLNNEVSKVYPADDVVRANGDYYRSNRPISARLRERASNNIPKDLYSYDDFCVKCPNDRTLVAKSGSDRVVLPYPYLKTCAGHPAPKDVHYEHMHGAQFGSVLVEGSYPIVGRITSKGKILKHCFMEVHVLTQSCPLPKYLVAHCGDQNKTCNFACRDPKGELHGSKNLVCGDDKKWIGHLPFCKVRSWCELPAPPPHGRVSCKGATFSSRGSRLVEGSMCRVRCVRGSQSKSHSIAICRRGSWTRELSCTLKRVEWNNLKNPTA